MSRKIKFRFWVKNEKRMEPPCDIWWNYIEYLDLINCDVMQYIGLKDKNGKEIYEGDIVKYDFYSYEVKWQIIDNPEMGNPMAIGFDFVNGQGEIIGNIYENPELIKDLAK